MVTSKSSVHKKYTMYLRVVFVVLCLLSAVGVSLVRAGDRLAASASLRGNSTQYLIASWRPVRDDLALATRLEGSGNVRYARGDTEFVKVLLEGVGLPEAEARARGLVVFEGTACVVDRLSGERDPLAAALARADRERRASEPSKIPLAVLGGVLLGMWMRFGPGMLRLAALAGVGLAVYQWMTACPTCPSVKVFGAPVSLIGACLYGALALGLASRRWSAQAGVMAAPMAAGILAWQSIAAMVTGTDCGPCAAIALLNAAVATSAVALRARPVAVGSPFGVRRMAVGVVVALAASIGASQFASRGLGGVPHDAPPPSMVGYRVQDLGLEPTGRPELVFLAMSQCGTCHEVLEYLGRHPEVEIAVYFTDRVPPAYQAFAHPVPNPHLVASTPTFLLVDSDGAIKREEKGWTLGDEWRKKFLDKLEAARVRLEEEKQ